MHYCDHGRYRIHTSPVENSVRPFCHRRRSWLFADSVAGAKASARLCSLVQCGKTNLPALGVHRAAQGPVTR